MIVTFLVIIAIASGVGAVAYATSCNRLVVANQEVGDAWAAVDVELERRHGLIPGLVNAVRATAAHERQLLTDLIEADRRAAAAEHRAATRTDPEAVPGNVVARRHRMVRADYFGSASTP